MIIMNKWLVLLAFIIACQLAGIAGSVFTTPAIGSWYVTLEKPWFTPPNWLFAPVWTTLYTLMGIALYLVYRKGFVKGKFNFSKIRLPVSIFAVQLALNVLWSMLFFGLRSPLYGLIGIIPLWIAIAATIVSFYRVSKPAGLILIPYIAWVSIATALNYYVWILNA
jgi:tryptophan-rich sensory protein